MPTTCLWESTYCGALFDGCETTLNCGVCPAAQTCAKEGPVTLCAAPADAPGVAWSRTWPGAPVTALATDSRENVLVMTKTEQGAAPLKLDPSGQQLWARSVSFPLFEFSGLSVTPSGELLAWGGRYSEFALGAAAYRLDATGDSPRLVERCEEEGTLGPYQENAQGQLLSSARITSHSRISYGPLEGGGWSLRYPFDGSSQDNPIAFDTATFDTDGAVLAMGSIGGQGTFQGQSFGTDGASTAVAVKLSPEGRLLWSREFTRARVSFFKASGSGSYVVAGKFRGSLTWKGGVLHAPVPDQDMPFLAALDSRGQVSWVQPLPLPPEHVALSASGRIAVASKAFAARSSSPHTLHLREYDLQGDLRWSRTWLPSDNPRAMSLHGMVWSGDAWVLGGSSQGTGPVNGTATWILPGSQGFVLKLQPAP